MTSKISADWIRLGVMLRGQASDEPVDLESLLISSLDQLRDDARLFWCIGSWLSVHHELVNTRRLGRMLDSLEQQRSALAGLLLEVALLQNPEAQNLIHLQGHCTELEEPQVLFSAVEKLHGYEESLGDQWLSEFQKWGFLHYQWTDKRDAVRPISWLIRYVREMRIRALLGAGQEAEILERSLRQPTTVTQANRELEYTYTATHSAAGRLIRRGLVQRVQEGREVYLRPDSEVRHWLETFPN